jgi:NAD+ synthase (glutamine-hydrolysing)
VSSIKISIAQLNYHTGNFDLNTEKIIRDILEAKASGIDLIVFSELCVSGYPPRDFLEFSDFIERCQAAVHRIAQQCVGIMAIVGGPELNPVPEGKDLYNAAFVLGDGVVKQIVRKTLLPNYDIFDEYRYFEPNNCFQLIECKGTKIALTICEDLWNINSNPMYVLNPMDELIKLQPALMINIAASPFSQTQIETRKQVMKDNVIKYHLPLLYVNMTGAQTHLIFDGGSMALNAQATCIDELNHFGEDHGYYTFDAKTKSLEVLHKHQPYIQLSNMEQVRQALVLGIREYFLKQGFSKAIIGFSGGIDSAVVLALAAQALGVDNVKALLMPSQYSSDHSISDSLDMVNHLGIKHEILPIQNAYQAIESTLSDSFSGTTFGLAEENIQSRLRGLLLMAHSNKFGYILLNTSNKSELAVGYGTLYGDMCGGLSVIGDLYKTQVYEMANHLNQSGSYIPQNIITKEPSAELRPEQKDSDSLPPYELLDEILYAYIEERKSPRQIIETGKDEKIVSRVLWMVNSSEWKRLQAPPVLRVSNKSFGPGRRMPIVAKYLS